MNNKTKALIKDLELQIDYLVGYVPSGRHWKTEHGLRQILIDNTLLDDNVPSEIKDKVLRIQDSLYRLRNKDVHKQDYMTYCEADYTIETHKPIVVNDWLSGQFVLYGESEVMSNAL